MFGGGGSNPYDDIVAKTTDENLTSENWELILNLCDKVIEEGDEGAHNVIAALLKRLAHRNPNVQLYALSLTDSLSKNCGIKVNKEIASRAFTQGLDKLVTDRTTHDKVRKRALSLIAEWTAEFENDTSLGVMEDCYSNLKSKGYKFETPQEPPPPAVDDEIRRKEEEELQRVLEMSMQDRGGRDQWSQYSPAAAGSSGAGSSSRPSGSSGAAAATGTSNAYTAPRYQGGYAPARTPSPQHQPKQPQPQTQSLNDAYTHSNASNISANSNSSLTTAATSTTFTTATPGTPTTPATSAIITRVKALHTFERTEPGELAFEKGDIIKVVDRGYKDWWRGQLKGRTGIFPVNYVEPMPEPTAGQLAKEAEQEATVFAQAVNVEKLLNLLRAFDPAKDNLADNEEIQELYRSSMALRPKIVKLIDKYSQKRADLVSMNETFVRARTIFDRMMEESLARHTGIYDQPTYRPSYASSGPSMRPDSRSGGGRPGGGREYVGSPVGGVAGGGSSYPHGLYGPPVAMPQAYPESQPQPVMVAGYPGGATPYGYAHPQSQSQPQPQQQQQQQPGYTNAPYASQGGQTPYPTTAGDQPPQTATSPQQQYQQSPQQQQPRPQQQQPYGQSPYDQPGYQQQQQQPQSQQAGQVQIQPQSSTVQLQQQTQPQPQQQQQLDLTQAPAHMQPGYQQTQPQAHPQQQGQAPPQQAQPQPQQQLAAVTQQAAQTAQTTQQAAQSQQPQPQPSTQSGPPYIFDPTASYSDPNVQAWAQYYAQGGKDLAGSVYFVSIPGLTDGNATGGGAGPAATTQTVGRGEGGYSAQVTQSQLGPQQQLPQQQQEHHPQGYDRQSVSYGVPSSSSPTSTTTNFPAQGQQQQLLGRQSLDNMTSSINTDGSVHGANPGYSPNVSTSTPSWVLPKKDSSNSPGGYGGHGVRAGTGGMSDGSNGAAAGAQGLTGRLAGVTLTDPGSAST